MLYAKNKDKHKRKAKQIFLSSYSIKGTVVVVRTLKYVNIFYSDSLNDSQNFKSSFRSVFVIGELSCLDFWHFFGFCQIQLNQNQLFLYSLSSLTINL